MFNKPIDFKWKQRHLVFTLELFKKYSESEKNTLVLLDMKSV